MGKDGVASSGQLYDTQPLKSVSRSDPFEPLSFTCLATSLGSRAFLKEEGPRYGPEPCCFHQVPHLNQNAWNNLEKYSRSLTRSYQNVYVCTGPLFLPR